MWSFLPPPLTAASAALAACVPAPQEAATLRSDPVTGATDAVARPSKGLVHAAEAQAPIPEAISAAEYPYPAVPTPPPADTVDIDAAVRGRRTLSTAFVRLGPDGYMTVRRRDGQLLVLKDVVMRPQDYCGAQVPPTAHAKRYCGGYAEVAAAKPGVVHDIPRDH